MGVGVGVDVGVWGGCGRGRGRARLVLGAEATALHAAGEDKPATSGAPTSATPAQRALGPATRQESPPAQGVPRLLQRSLCLKVLFKVVARELLLHHHL